MTVEIPFRRDFAFEYGRLEPVAPGIRRIVARNPGPFTFRGTGTYVVGEGEVAVIDPGPDLPEHVEALLMDLAGETVTHILVTHTHRDHSPAAAGEWSRCVWVTRMWVTVSPARSISNASTCSGRSGPGSITATSPSPTTAARLPTKLN